MTIELLPLPTPSAKPLFLSLNDIVRFSNSDMEAYARSCIEADRKVRDEVMSEALAALTPLANAHTPIERELLTDANVERADAAITKLQQHLGEKT